MSGASVSSTVTLDGTLALDVVGGFTLASGEVFDFLSGFSGLSGGFSGVTVDGAACSAKSADVWTCAGGFDLTMGLGANVLSFEVASSGGGGGGGGAVPEASTWAMMVAGFAGLGALGRRRLAHA